MHYTSRRVWGGVLWSSQYWILIPNTIVLPSSFGVVTSARTHAFAHKHAHACPNMHTHMCVRMAGVCVADAAILPFRGHRRHRPVVRFFCLGLCSVQTDVRHVMLPHNSLGVISAIGLFFVRFKSDSSCLSFSLCTCRCMHIHTYMHTHTYTHTYMYQYICIMQVRPIQARFVHAGQLPG